MSKPSRKHNPEELAEEARRWDNRELSPHNWQEAPESIPRIGETKQICLRLPEKQLAILKEFAARNDIGYQVLIKRWLDDRIRQEKQKLVRTVSLPQGSMIRIAAAFSPNNEPALVKSEAS